MRKIDISGHKYGRLTVLEECGNKKWKCICECGKNAEVLLSNLRSGHTKSCGCWVIENSRQKALTHGKSKSPLFGVLNSMKARCYNSKSEKYKNYGARGIKICDEWLNSFESFYQWAIENGYLKGLTIDRIDVNGNYEPANCKWSTIEEQENNRTNNRIITYKGESHTVAEWSQLIGISYSAMYQRCLNNWSLEKMFNTPQQVRRAKL